jgi:glycine dehydrogenase
MPVNYFPTEKFVHRHLGFNTEEMKEMLAVVGSASMEEFIQSTIPPHLRAKSEIKLPNALTENEALTRLAEIAEKNDVYRSFIGLGYHDTITPSVILRNILENPGWYTQYTPYQAEISQGRLEALLNYQTMVIDMTGFPVANASLLDEATASAEAMFMFFGMKGEPNRKKFFVSDRCHPQTIAVLKTRAEWLGYEIVVGDHERITLTKEFFGVLLQYPTTDGGVLDYSTFTEKAHGVGALVAAACDLMSLAVLKPPAEWGADVALGNTQRFGIPMGFGGPHAAFFATKDEFKRQMPGRIIGISIDAQGNRALRMALQTREQHIRREKATSNICTSQVLLAIMAGMYAVYHGPDGVKIIAERIHNLTKTLAKGMKKIGWQLSSEDYFDTLRVRSKKIKATTVRKEALKNRINLRYYSDGTIGISLDELTSAAEVKTLLAIFSGRKKSTLTVKSLSAGLVDGYHGVMKRSSTFLTHDVFHAHHSETEMLRYIKMLETRDLSLTASMIPLGSCTMKLNATTEMLPISWKKFGALHPYAPADQTKGYRILFDQLEQWLCAITGMKAVSLQPNSGAQGELSGLQVIRAFHKNKKQAHRNICLIPASAHGTNPASAVIAGMEVVVVRCDEKGNIDLSDLRAKAAEHKDRLAAVMVTYPSTHGVFEEGIKELCAIVHTHGGLVYLDGANLNAQVGLMKPAELGADVCHINLHKTFAIPHGGGGPGAGPITVTKTLAPFLPGNVFVSIRGSKSTGCVSSAPWGSASILPISWAYIAMMGTDGLRMATEGAILSANYLSKRLAAHYNTVFTGMNGRVAHEFIIDLRPFKDSAGIEAEDVSKRIIDYGFHAPTVSFPEAGTMMIEPTESEPKAELDRLVEALIGIREEIREIELGKADRQNNILKNSPHTAALAAGNEWSYPYSREKAVFPTESTRDRKFWPHVARVNNVYGDRHLVCACQPIEFYMKK